MSEKKGLKFTRVYTSPDKHPYDGVQWKRTDVVLKNWRDGSTNFEQYGVEFPEEWSDNAIQIVVSKYFRGTVGTPERETSLKQVISRIVNKYVDTGLKEKYFASNKDANAFEGELVYILLHQIASFNSPVWFNVGTKAKQQVSACFLLGVEDTMDSILNWITEEGMIFKGGSGAGVNLSKLRGSMETLSIGGVASGPISFMRGADASAGAIKSGGANRRSAKLVCLDVDHPDIEEFIQLKSREEKKIRALRDAGFDMDLDGVDSFSVQYQNANNSVRVSDTFMRAVEQDKDFSLTMRKDGSIAKNVNARALFHLMAQAAWECADPGIQYDNTIQTWHTNKNTSKITTSNPCSEYMSIDDSSCNLSSINLMKFFKFENGNPEFDNEKFVSVCEILTTAMDISICFADFPTDKIRDVTRSYRQLGLGYANLGALLMAFGLPYDSDEGRNLAAAITSLMGATAYRRSAEMAAVVGSYEGFAANRDSHLQVLNMHDQAASSLHDNENISIAYIIDTSFDLWGVAKELAIENGLRNAQLTLLAPCGTIGLAMGCDTTGIEPALGLTTYKKLVGGGSMNFTLGCVEQALETLGYDQQEIDEINEYIKENGTVVGAPYMHIDNKCLSIFDTAMGQRAIEPMGHVKMMAAVQPFLSGSISKTVNLPETAIVEDIEEIYMQGWKLGLKSLAVYRDNCKVAQPLSIVEKKEVKQEESKQVEQYYEDLPTRRKLPKSRPSRTYSFSVNGADGYMTVSAYEDGSLAEMFLKASKQGSTLAGILDSFAIAISIGLQYGVPLETYVSKFTNMRFEPSGLTGDPDIRMATSILDYLFRRLAVDYLPYDTRADLGILTMKERAAQVEQESTGNPSVSHTETPTGPRRVVGTSEPSEESGGNSPQGAGENPSGANWVRTGVDLNLGRRVLPLCLQCGNEMIPAGSCFACTGCGATSGCS